MPRPPRVENNFVFLNIPYDRKFRRQYLAYIVGLTHLGLVPKVTLGIPGGDRRLERICALIKQCRYSVHDLSRVEIDRTPPATPRFNMPFELGLAVAWANENRSRHMWFVCESENRRISKSLSDLDGTDAYIHGGSSDGILRQLSNAFEREIAPTMKTMRKTYAYLESHAESIRRRTGCMSLFEARIFNELCFTAKIAVEDGL